jgi:hypothetical protein
MHILLPICGKFTRAQIAHQIFLTESEVLNFEEKPAEHLKIPKLTTQPLAILKPKLMGSFVQHIWIYSTKKFKKTCVHYTSKSKKARLKYNQKNLMR